MRGDQVALLGALAWRVPALRAPLDDHLDDNEGEILPHPLMSEYERWAEGALHSDDSRLSEFLEVLEEAYTSGGDEIENLVSVSFLEHLPPPGETGSEIRERLGPALRRQLALIG